MVKTGIGSIELMEKLGEKLHGIELTAEGVVQVKQGLSIIHDERRKVYIVSIGIGQKTFSLELHDVSRVIEFVVGAA